MNKPLGQTVPSSSPDLDGLLAGEKKRQGYSRTWIWLGAIAAIATALYLWGLNDGSTESQVQYRTESAIMGPLVVKVSATGNLQPTNQVDVGSELSGIVASVHVDENDRVEKGQLLAQLDLSKLEDAVARSKANLEAAEAQLLQIQATLEEADTKLTRYREVSRLSGGKVPSSSEMDAAEAELKRAQANDASARAAIALAKAELQSDETDLEKAHIRSPIDGVVLDRQVEPGQTVAASFQAPVLFTLAEDLSQMELHVDVDEADVGQVHEGQPASFTVDAWPTRLFEAKITRVGYGAQEDEGVISYLTILKVANDDLSLRPGMTGTAEITTLTRDNVMLVPNAALRYTPAPAAAEQSGGGGSILRSILPRPPRDRPKPRPAAPNHDGHHQVWVLEDGESVPRQIRTGATDGRVTEVLSGDLKPGDELITEAVTKAK